MIISQTFNKKSIRNRINLLNQKGLFKVLRVISTSSNRDKDIKTIITIGEIIDIMIIELLIAMKEA